MSIIETQLAKDLSSQNAKKVREYVKGVEVEGNFSQLKLWKLKKKLCPKIGDPPMAKKDSDGNLVTQPSKLKRLYQQTYQHRLRNREMLPELMDIYLLKMHLWCTRLKEIESVRTEDWKLCDLRKAIGSLKNNKSTDRRMTTHPYQQIILHINTKLYYSNYKPIMDYLHT